MYVHEYMHIYIHMCIYVSKHRFVIEEMHVHIGCANIYINVHTGVSIMHEYMFTQVYLNMHSKHLQIYELLHI